VRAGRRESASPKPQTILRAARIALGIGLSLAAAPASADVWSDSYDPATKTRFIPVELWTGSPWDGGRSVNWPQADLHFDGGNKRITGPHDWTDPLDGQVKQAYRRYQAKQRKTQWFVVREDGTGIGRVEDSRWKDIERGESKFPVGLWTQGEERTYEVTTFGRNSRRPVSVPGGIRIVMERIDHVYAGMAHCMTFRWQKTVRDKIVDNNAYTYCPGRGLASLDDD
jgi:hypothetical protein